MPKKDPILVKLGECPEKWNPFLLKTYRLPQEPSTRKEKQQDCIRVVDPKTKRPVPVSLDEVGESATLPTSEDELVSLHQEAAADESIKLSPDSQRYVDFLFLFADANIPKPDRDVFKRMTLEDARSRYWEIAEAIPAELGSIDNLRRRWLRGEIEFEARAYGRQRYVIHVVEIPMPPDEPEDLDGTGEPPGHWDGLTFVPDPPETDGS